ncbi:MAG TPA: lipid-A-disaccharide synthase N-terminal domain-containing protein [Thermoanaerobaculia bacterium]|nr:lipid-A-disaccharide synthase N-terminal domain-containing protein [Thermoanaerobaculia bacterium]
MSHIQAEPVWLAIGLFGQAMFFGRFFVQWLASERKRQSVVPRAFWFLSLAGGLILLVYAVHRREPVFVLGQATGLLIYLRNIWLIYRPRARKLAPPPLE